MAKEVWNKILSQVKKRVPESQFEIWFKPLSFVRSEDKIIYVAHPNPLASEFIDKEFKELFDEIIKDLQINDLSVSILYFAQENGEELVLKQDVLEKDKGKKKSTAYVMSLNPTYLFDNFVQSHTNQFAYAACMAVSQNPAKDYNPLYVYGGVGLGKSHLLQSIAHYLLEHSKSQNVFYLSTERFMNELVASIRHNNQQDFREKYRKVDVLILDDVQFMKDKTGLQQELFHTFNALYENQKQIVISSDCTPSDLMGIEDRLRSRFAWGLIAEIQPPDLETKIAILHKKAEAKKVDIPDDVALYIASNINSNVRELEGCLTRVIAVSNFKGKQITIHLAEEALEEQFGATGRLITIEKIQKFIANEYKISVSDLKEKTNRSEVVNPRQIAMYLCKHLLNISLKEIGRKFGGKDHSTVIHSIKKVEEKMGKDKNYKQYIDTLIRGLH